MAGLARFIQAGPGTERAYASYLGTQLDQLHDIAVDLVHRGIGVGQRLLEATLAALKARGVPRVVLSTAEGNVAAQRLFARAGFRATMHEMTRELWRRGALNGAAPSLCLPRLELNRAAAGGEV